MSKPFSTGCMYPSLRIRRAGTSEFDPPERATYRGAVGRVDQCSVSASAATANDAPSTLATPGRPTIHSRREPREQAYVPAEQPSSREDARVPSPDAHACRPGDPLRPPEQGSPEAGGLRRSGSGAGHGRVCAMLDRAHRLTEHRQFDATIRGGRRAGAPSLVVHVRVMGEPADGTTRAGFVVGKAVGNAVERNRVKRRLRHLVRDRLDRLPGGSAIVVRALPPAVTATPGQLAAELDGAVTRALRPSRQS